MNMDELKLELAIHKHVTAGEHSCGGSEYVTSKTLAERVEDESAKSMGWMLREAEQRGWVERWSYTKQTTWRILI